MSDTRTILVTNALPYANGDIHLGHLVGYIQADIWVRFQRLRGHNVFYLCADDTHGTPVMLRAEAEGITPEELITRMQAQHIADFRDFLVEFDLYYTTHSPENRAWAELIYRRLQSAGLIAAREIQQYFDPVKGIFLPDRYIKGICPRCRAADQYGDNCEVCGAAYSPAELIEPRSALSGAKPELRASTHYFFRLSAPEVATFLQAFVVSCNARGEPVLPLFAQRKLAEWLGTPEEPRLSDWDITRDAPYFGFEIPDAPGKYFYVWLDAPIGYLATFTALAKARGFDPMPYLAADGQKPCELIHFIGKDILYFHALFWPAMLHFAGLRTPSREFINGFLTINGAKMSKSRGTFITARAWLEAGLDAELLRYYFASKSNGTAEDLDLVWDDLVAKVNSDLVGKYVNIASRLARLLHTHFEGRIGSVASQPLVPFIQARQDEALYAAYEEANFAEVLRRVQELMDRANGYINEQKPWLLAQDASARNTLHEVLSTALTMFRDLTLLLKPILPRTAKRVEDFLNIAPLDFQTHWAPLPLGLTIRPYEKLLTRIDKKDLSALIAPEASNNTPAALETKPHRAQPASSTITIEQFSAVELRVAQIMSAEIVPEAHKLLKLTVDVGEKDDAGNPKLRTIFAGIKGHYEPEALKGRLVVVVANLAPRAMRFGVSEGMLLAASDEAGHEAGIFLITPDAGAKPGMRVK